MKDRIQVEMSRYSFDVLMRYSSDTDEAIKTMDNKIYEFENHKCKGCGK